jgi:hypothetical protein
MLRNMNKSQYNSFDPNNYDPTARRRNNADNSGSAGYGTQSAQPGNKMQVNLTLNNPTASNLNFEMFSFLDSFLRRLKTEYVTGAYLYVPMSSYEGLRRTVANTGGTVGFTQDGQLCIRGLDTAADPVGTLVCKEIAYSSFFEASGITAFDVAYFRMTTSNDAQIDETFTYYQKTFSGGVLENPISPRAYFKPTQFQDFTIDVTVSFSIGIDRGIKYVVLAGQSVKINLFIQSWTLQTLQ